MNLLRSITFIPNSQLQYQFDQHLQLVGFQNLSVRKFSDMRKTIRLHKPHLIVWEQTPLLSVEFKKFSNLLDASPYNILICSKHHPIEEKFISHPAIYQVLEEPISDWRLRKALHLAKMDLDNIQNLKRLKKEMEKIRSYWEGISGSITDAVFIINPNFEVEACNPAACRLLQIDETILQHQSLPQFFEDGLDVLNQVYRQLLDGYDVEDYRIKILPQTGAAKKVTLRVKLMNNTSSENQNLIVILKDDAIHQQLLEQTERQAKFETMKQFSGAIAHEIINPINILSGRLQLLKREAGEKVPPKTFETIEKQIERIAEVVNELNKFAILKNNEVLEKFQLVAFLQKLFKNIKKNENFKVILNAPPGIEKYLIEANRYQLEDAFKYLFEIIARHRADQKPIRVEIQKTKPSGSNPVLEVLFYFPSHMPLESLFEPFQLFSTEDHLSSFGVAIMETIFRNFGVKMTIQKEVGKGKTLRLQFPVINHQRKKIKQIKKS